jgi:AcrR family transcriptional regulator
VIVETVLELAAERNPTDITTQAIAERMGQTQGALFRHFRNKEAIWEEVIGWVAGRLLTLLAAATREGEGDRAVTVLERMFEAHLEFVAAHPAAPRLILGELQREEETPAKRAVRALMRRYRERVREQIERGKATGELASDLDVDAAVTLFLGTIQGLVVQSLVAGGVSRMRSLSRGTFAIYRRGLEGGVS